MKCFELKWEVLCKGKALWDEMFLNVSVASDI